MSLPNLAVLIVSCEFPVSSFVFRRFTPAHIDRPRFIYQPLTRDLRESWRLHLHFELS